jgi:glycosyltransferase involved in cell wall biosynthesis
MINIPLLSIVIPTYNRVDSLYSLIDSIGHKNDPELEIVISDDHSDHEIFQKLKIHLSEYSNISLFRSAVRLGMVKNWNESINKARGEWICFICDDDLFHPNGVSRIIQLIKKITTASLVIQSPTITTEKEFLEPGVEAVRELNFPLVSGNFWHRQITDRLGGFDERIKYSPDAEFWYRIAFNYPVVKIKEPFAKYISHEHNYAFTTWMKADFLDQVGLICKINSTYFNGKDGATLNNTIDAEEIGKDQTILTILKTTCMRTSKKQIFIKYYKIGLERSKNRRDALSFRILILNIFIKRIIAMCRVLARSWL